MEKRKLDRNYHGKFCSCCGRKSITIWNKLLEQKPDESGQKKWKEHTLYPPSSPCGKNNTFYDTNITVFCENCGLELDDEEFNTVMESRGECHGAPCSEQVLLGYKCEKCGHIETF